MTRRIKTRRSKTRPATTDAVQTPPPFALYPRNRTATLDLKLFANPTAEYRGTPFWSWNNKLDRAQLLRQIDQFREMGFGGVHIHSRAGLDTEYLGEEFLDHIRACTEYAAARDMLTWLYDEDRWPSGFAGGLVTRDPAHRMKFLRWTMTASETSTPIGRYEITLRDGCLSDYRQLKDGQKPAKGTSLWYAYLETERPSSRYNHQTNVDVMSRAAIERFIETTHEPFARTVGRHFGNNIPAIFTDEPQTFKKQQLRSPGDTNDVCLPYTTDFGQTYAKAYRQSLEDHLPELIWELPEGRTSQVRYRYHDHLAERFASAFGDTLSEWCAAHGLALTGHMLSEASLHGQSRSVGEAMRVMRGFQLPGMDLLEDNIEFVTAKQAQSLAHQYGRPGVISELYGVTNWDFDFAGHKRQGDWQAAMGVTVRVPHLAWVSMAGESKRDYPAAIGYQSPWYREYGVVENHFARLHVALTRGRPKVRVAVIHPIESFWLKFGVIEQTGGDAQQMQKAFTDVAEWLAYGLIDFDYVSEALLPHQSTGKQGKTFRVGQMKYDAVVVPSLRTIRASTLQRLEQFAKAGGTVIVAGDAPALVDARPSAAGEKLARRSTHIALARPALLKALAPLAEVTIRHMDGSVANSIVHQIREEGNTRIVFFANTDRQWGRSTRIRLRGAWDVTHLDTLAGTTAPLPAQTEKGFTTFAWTLPAHGHLLLSLAPAKRARPERAGEGRAGQEQAGPKHTPPSAAPEKTPVPRTRESRLSGPVPVTLSEPNVLLLDQAEWRLDDSEWHDREEILRIDDLVRTQRGLPLRGGQMAQPWTDTLPTPVVGRLQLRFAIRSSVNVAAPQLAMEVPSDGAHGGLRLELDGQPVPVRITGWWVDEAIQTLAIPPISAGEHELIVTLPLTRKTDVEWCYLLGDFGVRMEGSTARLIEPVRSLHFGDWTHQGLPFYAGNVTYHLPIEGNGEPMKITFPKFRTPLLKTQLNDEAPRPLAFAPFEVDLGNLEGEQTLHVTAFGNRINAFGPLHQANEALTWIGPAAWRSNGAGWAYEYQLKRMGLLSAPILSRRSDK